MSELRQYVTGDNAPGHLPDIEPHGPWNGWDDAVRDLSQLIETDAETRLDEAESLEGDERGEIQSYLRAELANARSEIAVLRQTEQPNGADVTFVGRAFFIRPAEA